jgi:hypothetical protein
MDRVIIRSVPSDVRARYGEELEELLADSARPVRDRADVLVAGLGLRLGSKLPVLLLGSVVCVGLTSAGFVHSVLNLQDGAVEVLSHWWSTFALLALTSSVSAMTLLALAQIRARTWREPA